MKGDKKLLIFSILCIAAGLALLFFSDIRSGSDLLQSLERVGAAESQTERSVEVKEPFRSLRVEEADADVQLLLSDDGGCRVVYGENEHTRCSVRVENDTLIVIREDDGVRSGLLYQDSLPLRIYLPGENYAELEIKASSSDVSAARGLRFEKAEIQTASGDIALQDFEAKELRLASSSGRIELEEVRAESLRADSASGDLRLRDCGLGELKLGSTSGDMDLEQIECAGGAEIHTASGDVELKDAEMETLELSGTSGRICLTETVCRGKLTAETSSGDIRLQRAAAGSYELRSTSGDVDGSVYGPVDFIVDTGSGDVRTKGGQRGAAPCQVSTRSGDVDLEALR